MRAWHIALFAFAVSRDPAALVDVVTLLEEALVSLAAFGPLIAIEEWLHHRHSHELIDYDLANRHEYDKQLAIFAHELSAEEEE